MDDGWLSYKEAGKRLCVSAEAARQRAIRGNWPRRLTNEGLAVIRIPEGVKGRPRRIEQPFERPVEQTNEQPAPTPNEHPLERVISALENHIETLKADLSLARAELAQERQASSESRATAQALAIELSELRARADQRPTTPQPAPRRSAPPRPKPAPERVPAPEQPHFVSRDDLETASGLAEIRRRIERDLARRATEEDAADDKPQSAQAHYLGDFG